MDPGIPIQVLTEVDVPYLQGTCHTELALVTTIISNQIIHANEDRHVQIYTGSCTTVSNEVIDYYVNNTSTVCCAMLDATNACTMVSNEVIHYYINNTSTGMLLIIIPFCKENVVRGSIRFITSSVNFSYASTKLLLSFLKVLLCESIPSRL